MDHILLRNLLVPVPSAFASLSSPPLLPLSIPLNHILCSTPGFLWVVVVGEEVGDSRVVVAGSRNKVLFHFLFLFGWRIQTLGLLSLRFSLYTLFPKVSFILSISGCPSLVGLHVGNTLGCVCVDPFHEGMDPTCALCRHLLATTLSDAMMPKSSPSRRLSPSQPTSTTASHAQSQYWAGFATASNKLSKPWTRLYDPIAPYINSTHMQERFGRDCDQARQLRLEPQWAVEAAIRSFPLRPLASVSGHGSRWTCAVVEPVLLLSLRRPRQFRTA
ncbi:hypothetical protein V8F33_011486 [Rhypophila sp. PSN 637]